MRLSQFLATTIVILCALRTASAIDPYAGNDPFWILLHEPAVAAELKLTESQEAKYRELLDGLDIRFFPLRNQTNAEAIKGMDTILSEVRTGLTSILEPAQEQRLNEILLQFLGNRSFLQPEIIRDLKLSNTQQDRMRETAKTADAALKDLYSKQETNQQPVERQYIKIKTEEQRKLLAILQPEQLNLFKKKIGTPFPLERLRKPAFKAPDIVNTKEWINSSGTDLRSLRGKVVVLHFYACGCINCIHNYPSYRQWQDQFKGKDVQLMGIHTPETSRERDVTFVRKKAEEENLKFPILIDGKQENWNAWGNSMWPSVYVIDKRGYLRDFWPGELNWRGTDGEKQLRARIEELVAESDESHQQARAAR